MSQLTLSLQDQLSLQQLNHDFAYYLDHYQVAPLVALFTEGAYYRHGQRISEGKEAIEALFNTRSAKGDRVARHVISGLRFEVQAPGVVKGTSVVVTWAADGVIPVATAAPYLVADFIDLYRYDERFGWRIERREIERIFVAENNQGPVGG